MPSMTFLSRMAVCTSGGRTSAYSTVALRFSKSSTGASIFFTSAAFIGSSGLWNRISMVVPPGALESPLPNGVMLPPPPMPPPICAPSYHLRPPLNPPLICSTSLSDSMNTLVICTRSPTRPAGPYSREAAGSSVADSHSHAQSRGRHPDRGGLPGGGSRRGGGSRDIPASQAGAKLQVSGDAAGAHYVPHAVAFSGRLEPAAFGDRQRGQAGAMAAPVGCHASGGGSGNRRGRGAVLGGGR